MLCFKDRSYCGSELHKPDCDSQITEEELKQAEKMGLPVAYIDYCDVEESKQ